MTKKRAIFYIDGFNLYHAIDNLRDENNLPRHHLKWLSLRSLAHNLIAKNRYQITEINYYTAVTEHRGMAAKKRHTHYIEALKATGVNVILGRFKAGNCACKACGHAWQTHEEKETDVNIATSIVRDAFLNKFDTCYIISGDTDLIPAVRILQTELPHKEIIAILPPFRKHGKQLQQAAHKHTKLKLHHLENSLFADKINHKSRLLKRPQKYTPPTA